MRTDELITFSKKHNDGTDFTGGVSDLVLQDIEEKLNTTLPNSYKWFLRNYGSGGLFGVDILGGGKSAIPSVIRITERLRTLELPIEYIVIEDCEEFFYCLDTSSFTNDECPVISWDRVAGFSGKRADSFQEFLSNRLQEAKENWEEDF